MNVMPTAATPAYLPPLGELGLDLLRVSRLRVLLSLSLPFFWCGSYFVCAAWGWWAPAVFALVALSFVTYGSISHDLGHRSLGMPRTLNDLLLCVVDLLALRSGYAYRAAHLHRHARYPPHRRCRGDRCKEVLAGCPGRGWAVVVRVGLHGEHDEEPLAHQLPRQLHDDGEGDWTVMIATAGLPGSGKNTLTS